MLMILQDCAIIMMGLWFLFLLKSRNEGRDGAGREAEYTSSLALLEPRGVGGSRFT